jgi:mRNA interferase RelE/StbE
LAYDAIWHEESLKDLERFGRSTAKKIIKKVKNYLTLDPIKPGGPLKGNLKGFYRYRIGEYGIIYVIDREEKKVIILEVKHRKEIYK